MNYEELLERAYKKVKKTETGERFEIPEVLSHVEGNKTIISNFQQIASYLRRSPEHLEKFLEKELAAQGKQDSERLILIRKIPNKKIQERIKIYTEKYVLCKECKKPDTELIKENQFTFIHCLACGAKHSIAKI